MNVLGVDIGGTGLKAAMVDTSSGKMISERIRIPTPESRTPEDVLPAVAELISQFKYEGPIGVGFPAVVQRGVPKTAFTAYQIESWVGYNVAEKLNSLTGNPIQMINDADAAGVAEMRFGAAVGSDSGIDDVVILLTLGTGIGSAMFVDGQLVPNTEFGHLYIGKDKLVAEKWTSEKIRIDEKLKWKAWAKRLNAYMTHLNRIFSPDLFILGGGVSKSHEKFIPRLTVPVKTVPAALRNHAGIIGAALIAVPAK